MNISDNIKIKLNNIWINANNDQKNAFLQFKCLNNHQIILNTINNNEFTIARENNATYIIENNGSKYPIADWNDVKVFLIDNANPSWYNARDYQTWSYFDFLYSNDNERRYKTRNSNNLNHNYTYYEIPIHNLYSNIIFRISRNDNGTIFYEKDDIHRTKVRISDNQYDRSGYMAYYRRLTDDIFAYAVPTVINPVSTLIIPDVPVSITLNDSEMCIVCNENKQNIKLIPCNHISTCSVCAAEILKYTHKLNCPICRVETTNVNKLD